MTMAIFVVLYFLFHINILDANPRLKPHMSNGDLIVGSSSLDVKTILDQIIPNSSTDRLVSPFYDGGCVDVSVSLHILSFNSMSEVNMDFTTDFYIRQQWLDRRLNWSQNIDMNGVNEDKVYLTVGGEAGTRIWLPDTYFSNEKISSMHNIVTPNAFLWIYPNGTVLLSLRVTVTASCLMNLQYFPLDRQICSIEIESYGYRHKEISYHWQNGVESVKMVPGLQLPQFTVVGHILGNGWENVTTGNYTRLVCKIVFARSLGYYLIEVYIPASLIVIISWISFWLSRSAIPARVALGVTTVLTMTTLLTSTNGVLPKVCYVKAIDVFLGTCFVMVFASLVEYALVSYLGKRIDMRRIELEQGNRLRRNVSRNIDTIHSERVEPAVPVTRVKSVAPGATRMNNRGSNICNNVVKVCGLRPSDIDIYSRIVFPLCFVLFNIMYWVIYLNISDDLTENVVPAPKPATLF